jgi:ADP-heptose:LPS heptosyltransferase
VLQRVDLLVTVDTAVTHLAGALGVPTLLCLPFCPDYRWGLSGSAAPWYRSVTLLRQPDASGWAGVLEDAAGRIASLRDHR